MSSEKMLTIWKGSICLLECVAPFRGGTKTTTGRWLDVHDQWRSCYLELLSICFIEFSNSQQRRSACHTSECSYLSILLLASVEIPTISVDQHIFNLRQYARLDVFLCDGIYDFTQHDVVVSRSVMSPGEEVTVIGRLRPGLLMS